MCHLRSVPERARGEGARIFLGEGKGRRRHLPRCRCARQYPWSYQGPPGDRITLEADKQLQALFGASFVIPHYPQTVLESTGAVYSSVQPYTPKVIVDGKLITGQDQSAASEYALAFLHLMTGHSPVTFA
ncbi:hypothetical protein [Tunturiibacter psychrotolerans]|uniref:hypothetical protein n=1 Tax=Tunturiibacter psychrotolerans TaxID=3069686 RepID=UPI003D1BCD43